MSELLDRITRLSPQKLALYTASLQARLQALERSRLEPIAVVGIGCRLPAGIDDPASFWRLLREGGDAVGDIPRERWDVDALYDPDPEAVGKMYTRHGGFLADVAGFDAPFFGISPREAESMDPQQRLLLEVSWEALEHAAIAPDALAGGNAGVFFGVSSQDYSRLTVGPGGDLELLDAHFGSGNAGSVAAGRLSYLLGLQGPSLVVDTACSSSLVALHLACSSLRLGECDVGLAGGVSLILSPAGHVALSRARMLAPDGRCKTFDAAADGFVRSEGCGVLVLKRQSDALADGDRILALLLGSAVNQDGRSTGLTVPNRLAQERLLRTALANAQVEPGHVSYVEAHGTGTSLGDPIEMAAIASVLCGGRAPRDPLRVGSVKTNLGHLEAAAGVAGLIKVVLMLQHREIPPHLHFRAPNPHIPWSELPVVVPTELCSWQGGGGGPLRASVSSFGFSGTNAHVVLEEAPPAAGGVGEDERPLHLITLSARSRGALEVLAGRLADHLAREPEEALADVGFTLNRGRTHHDHRLALWAESPESARQLLAAYALGRDEDGLAHGRAEPGEHRKVAFLFPGQGSHHPGVGRRLYATQPTFRRALDRCDEILQGLPDQPFRGERLPEILFRDPAGGPSLDETRWGQPALFALEHALAELWMSWGIRPGAVLGHSLGGYVAACVAGVFGLEDGLRLVAERGRLLGALPRRGSMAAVAAGEERVRAALCGRPGIAIAAVNAPRQTVVSGEREAVEALLRELAAEGIESRVLTRSDAFHSSLVEPAVEPLERVAREIAMSSPRRGLISDRTGNWVDPSKPFDPADWGRHLREPVRFAAGIDTLHQAGYDLFLEIGPRPRLAALGRQCVPAGAAALWLPSLRPGRDDWETLLASLGALYTAGAAIDWAGFDRDARRHRLALPTYPFERRRYWLADSPEERTGGRASHPLLGRRLESPLAASQFRSRVGVASPRWLGDHRLGDRAVVPASAYLDLALAAALETLTPGRGSLEIRDLVIRQPLALPAAGTVALQTVLLPEESGSAAVRVFSQADPGEAASWVLHAEGRVGWDETAPEAAAGELEEARTRCRGALEPRDLYARLLERGVALGCSFRTVEMLWRGDGEGLGRIRLPEGLEGGFAVHPALLDGCFQVLAAALPGEPNGPLEAFLPIAVDSLRLRGPVGGRVWCLARLREAAGPAAASFTGDLQVFDDSGEALLEVRGLALKRTAAEPLDDRLGNWFYTFDWEPRGGLPEGGAASWPPGPATLAGRLAPLLERLAGDPGLGDYAELVSGLEELGFHHALQALRDLGWRLQTGAAVTVESVARELSVAPDRRRLLGRLLEILEEERVLERQGAGWTVVRDPGPANPGTLEVDLRRRCREGELELDLLERCASRLPEVLRGRVDPLDLLFPGGSLETAERLYQSSPVAAALGGIVREVVAGIARDLPPDRRLRILEVGGGTGGTTAHLLSALPADRVEYRFTDLSPRFVAHGEAKLGHHPGMRCGLLDIERDPEAQGYPARGCDVLLASNVLHATADLGRSLGHLRRLLAPGGLLVLVEGTRRTRQADLTFGLTDGWWKFTDTDLRPSHPLLASDRWLDLLAAEGFTEAVVLPAGREGRELLAGQRVILARRPERWLIFADARGTGGRLAADLAARREVVAEAHAGDSYRRLAPAAFQLRPGDAGDMRRLLLEAFDGASADVVAHLWSLDAPRAEPAGVGFLEAARVLVCDSVLHLVQALASAGDQDPPRLWLITRGAQATAREAGPPAVAQSPLWGLARVIAREHPELRCGCLDLEEPAAAGEGDALLHSLGRSAVEGQVALRGGVLLTPRLVERPLAGSDALPPLTGLGPGGPLRLEITRRGTLEGLSLRPAARRKPGAAEVEIRVRATGLNFKDVLSALGLYPGPPQAPGEECAGVVTAVGPGVAGLRAGDEVVAVSPGSFGSFLTVAAAQVRRKPRGMSLEQAASLPVAFLTAAFALELLGKVRPGERILIHAAAGGVGLAAVQLAQRAGAEVLATASPAKWDLLRSLGVRHLASSRSLDFAGAFREATGGEGVDLVLNSLSDEFIPRSLELLRPSGRFVEIGRRGIWSLAQVAELRPDVAYFPLVVEEEARRDPAAVAALLDSLMARFDAGALSPLPIQVFPLREAAQAFRTMEQAKHVGKLVVTQPPDASYLVTGGLSGLGLQVARWLAERGAACVVLVGRREPAAPARRLLEEIEAAGTQVRVVQADVSREEDLERLFAGLGAGVPPLRGVFHAAGQLDDGVLLLQTPERFARVMAPKVEGAWKLHELTRDLPLDCFVLFSAGAALLGSPGQGNHAAANTFLDALAHYRRTLGLPALSIDWGPWSEVGAAARGDVAARAAQQGMGSLSPAQGLAALAHAMAQPSPQIAVLPFDRRDGGDGRDAPRQTLREGAVRPAAEPGWPAPRPAGWRIEGAGPAERRRLAGLVAEEARRALGLATDQPLDPRRPLHEMGLDSLMAVELRNVLAQRLGRSLPATLLFDYPTVEALSGHLAAEPVEEAARAGTPLARPPVEEPIAIIGMGCRFPGGADSPAAFWERLLAGTDAIREVPAERWDVDAFYDPNPHTPGKTYSRHGGFLDGIDHFDARFFGISPREAICMDPQQRLLLEVAWEALEEAGIPPDGLAGSSTGVFVGICGSDYLRLVLRRGEVAATEHYAATGNSASVAAGRLSYVLGLQGPALSVDTACSSSLAALHLACQSLRRGECDLALAGGVNVILGPEMSINFAATRALAPDGRCKAFAAGADGYVRSEGCGMVVLKRLSAALSDGDAVIAVVRCSGMNQDGRSNGLTAPNGQAQEALIRRVVAEAGIEPGAVGYVEAHGTGTPLGDPIEARALGAALGQGRPPEAPLRIGSVKTNLGHLEAAAGIAGLIKAALILQQGEIPPHLHFLEPNPLIPWDELRLEVAARRVPWPSGGAARLVGVSSFGFSGTNVHVVLEEAPAVRSPAEAPTAAEEPSFLLPLSARDSAALRCRAESFRALLAGLPAGDARALGDLCATAALRRTHHDHRLAVVGDRADRLAGRLDELLRGELSPQALSGRVDASGPSRPVLVFSGHGSQSPGMAQRLRREEMVFREALDDWDARLNRFTGGSVIAEMEAEGERSRLDQVDVVQPVVFAVQMALAALWRSWGIEPAAVLGHSLGEVAAAHVAGALSADDAARIVCLRSRLLTRLQGRGGAMAVVELDVETARHALAGWEGRLSVAACNSNRSLVLSGDREALAEVLQGLQRRNVFCRWVKADGAGHSPEVDALADELFSGLAGIAPRPAAIPLMSTVTGEPIDGLTLDAGYWFLNLRRPVLFSQAVHRLIDDGHLLFLEASPHPILLPAIEADLRQRGSRGVALPSLRRGAPERESLLSSLGGLYTQGCAVDWRGLFPGRRRPVGLPAYPWQRKRFWIEDDRPGKVVPPPEARREGYRSDWIYQTEWQLQERQVPSSAPGADERPSRWLILPDLGGVGAALAGLLRAQGATCSCIAPGAGATPEDFAVALRQAAGEEHLCGVVDLGGLDAPAPDAAAPQDTVAAACARVLHLLQALVGTGLSGPLWVITSGAQTTGDGDCASGLAQAPLWGLGRVAGLEHPGSWGGLIDLSPADPPELAAAQVLREVIDPDGEDQVAYRGGCRLVARLTRSTPAMVAGAPTLRPDATYLITGGLGGIGLNLARWLVAQGARHLVLLGRRGLPAPVGEEGRGIDPRTAAVRALEAAGACVTVVQADVGDRDQMTSLLAELRRSGPRLRGVLHAAGVDRTCALTEIAAEDLEAVLRPKVAGAWFVHELTEDLDFLVLFSSAAATWGSQGLAHYAAANCFLDALAWYRRARGLPALSIAWGGWAGGGMLGEEAESFFRHLGLEVMPVGAALDALAALLAAGVAQRTIAAVDWAQFIPVYAAKRRRPFFAELAAELPETVAPNAHVPELVGCLLQAPPEERRDLLRTRVSAEAAAVLGLDVIEDQEDGFFQLGMDSIMTIRLRDRLQALSGRPLPPTLVFEHPTVAALTDFLAGELGCGGGSPEGAPAVAASPAAGGKGEGGDLLDWVRGLSEDEVDRFLEGDQ